MTQGLKITDPTTGIYIIGYVGQSREQLEKELAHRVAQWSK